MPTPRIRALFDTNIFISYLLPSRERSAVHQIMEAVFADVFTLLLAQELVDEFSATVARKKYLSQRIAPHEAQELIETLLQVAEVIPAISADVGRLPATSRDPKDDYLLAYAAIGQAAYLVTGDADLATLLEVAGCKSSRRWPFSP